MLIIFTVGCKNNQPIVESSFVDSVLNSNTASSINIKEQEVTFWKNRVDTLHPGITNELRYASALATRFAATGDIRDIITADSILYRINERYNGKEASPFKMLAAHAITRHHFREADSLIAIARQIGLKKYDEATASFDVDFELGRHGHAGSILDNIKNENDYGYNFRQSKLAHYKGDIDSAINYMMKAVTLAQNNIVLKQTALSNVGDLYLHSGDFSNSYNAYKTSLRLNTSDNHSLLGIGWIVLVHDKNDSLAKAIFTSAQSRTKLPDPLYKLSQACQASADSIGEITYANEFAEQATDTLYGGMYNKYLIELYTGILHDAARAESLAKGELNNRSTPQTHAWYTWALYCNNKKDEAYKEYTAYVSGKPLEALELYYMGKMMKSLGKGYNAHEYFKAASQNKYDLSPRMIKDITDNLEE